MTKAYDSSVDGVADKEYYAECDDLTKALHDDPYITHFNLLLCSYSLTDFSSHGFGYVLY